MTETNAQDIRFALVDESGHLTGKPAEGVAAAIDEAVQKAIDALPKQNQASTNALGSEALNEHYDQLFQQWKMSKGKNAINSAAPYLEWDLAAGNMPHLFWMYIFGALAAAQQDPAKDQLLAQLFFEVVGEDFYGQAEGHIQDLLDNQKSIPKQDFENLINGLGSSAALQLYIPLMLLLSAQKIKGVDTLEVVGDNLRVTKGGRTGSVPITWDAA